MRTEQEINAALLAALPKAVCCRHCQWNMGIVPWAALTLPQAWRIVRGMGCRLPGERHELSLGKLESRELWLNGCTLWLTNQLGDLSWHIGKSGYGPSQFVLKVV